MQCSGPGDEGGLHFQEISTKEVLAQDCDGFNLDLRDLPHQSYVGLCHHMPCMLSTQGSCSSPIVARGKNPQTSVFKKQCVEKEPERCRGPGAPLLEFPWEEVMAPYCLSVDLIYETCTQLSRNVCFCVVKPYSASPGSTQTNSLKQGRSPSFPSMRWLETTSQCFELKSHRGHWPCVAMGPWVQLSTHCLNCDCSVIKPQRP